MSPNGAIIQRCVLTTVMSQICKVQYVPVKTVERDAAGDGLPHSDLQWLYLLFCKQIF